MLDDNPLIIVNVARIVRTLRRPAGSPGRRAGAARPPSTGARGHPAREPRPAHRFSRKASRSGVHVTDSLPVLHSVTPSPLPHQASTINARSKQVSAPATVRVPRARRSAARSRLGGAGRAGHEIGLGQDVPMAATGRPNNLVN